MSDANSGFLKDDSFFVPSSNVFGDIEIILLHDAHFMARATRYGRLWALKGLRKEYFTDVRQRQQLMKEFEILSSLKHPGIVGFVGLEEVDSYGLCIIMEWIEGITLEAALMKKTLSKHERHRILTDIVEAVSYLHSKGIVHRDLKPSNIMLRQNGNSPIIVDFDLADTDAYIIIKNPAGTPGYISERQKEASTPDTSDDVYSLGVVMKSLYPEYAAIARRCTGNPSHRYRDAAILLKAIRRRDRVSVRLATVVSVALFLALVAWLADANRGLSSSVDMLEDNITQMSENHQSIQKQLADSIDILKKELSHQTDFRDSIARHDAYMAESKLRLKDELEKAYAQFLKMPPDTISKFPRNAMFSSLCQTLGDVKKRFYTNLNLTDDRDYVDMENAFGLYFSDILERWNKEYEKTSTK